MDKEGFRDVDELTVGLNNGYEPVSIDDEPVKKEEPVEEVKKEVAEEKPAVKAAPAGKKAKKTVKKKAGASKKKVAKKKAVKKTSKSKTKKKKVSWIPITLISLVIVAVAVLAYLFFSTGLPSDAERLAAMVNNDPIYMADLESRHNFLRHTVDPDITRDETLNQMIEERLLSQYAEEQGLSVTRQEVERDMEDLLLENQLTRDELMENLMLMGVEYEDFITFNKDRLLITLLVEEELEELSEPTGEEVRAYYDAFPEQFGIPDSVQVRHILIGVEGRTDEEALEEAERVMGLIDDDKGNFCDLVREYTDDVASAETCGEYNYSLQDPLVPEFLEAGFDMEPGEIRNVRTQFGYHVMYKVSDIEGDQLGFEDIEADLTAFMAQEKLVGEYQDLVAELRRESIIEIYTEDESPVSASVARNSNSVPVKEVEDTDEARKMNLARCLGDLDAQLFKVYWCPYCDDQIEMFGDHIRFIDVVECDPDMDDARPELCREYEISSFPTWVIDGEKYRGMRTLNALAGISGCDY